MQNELTSQSTSRKTNSKKKKRHRMNETNGKNQFKFLKNVIAVMRQVILKMELQTVHANPKLEL